MLLEFPDADGRVIRTIASPIRMSSSVPDVRVVPPRLGQHTEQVLSESGYSEEQIRRLVADGIVQ
jgi:crotonobetainyl-CoA:carnitine CoA-transferase CaiB-like acyl-CoA transferase